MSGLIWVHSVCKNYQQTTLGKELNLTIIYFQVTIKAADGDGRAVTGVTFWDSDDDFHLYNHIPPPDWTQGQCACCYVDPVVRTIMVNSLHAGYFFMLLLSSADFFKINFFEKNLPGTLSTCQTFWNLI